LRVRCSAPADRNCANTFAWIEDPSNGNEVYARVRARRTLADLEGEGLNPMRFAALAERLRTRLDEIDKRAAALIAEAATFDEGAIVLDRTLWRGEDVVRQRALEVLIIVASGEERGPSPAQLETLSAALNQADFAGATLAGAWLQPRGTRVIIRRDPGALSGRADGAVRVPPLPLSPGRETVWDGRLAVTVHEPGWSIIAEEDAPLLARGDTRAPLSSANTRWLLRERVEHALFVS
jgi:tRNA(Ile)-lysidine synthase